MDFNMLPCTKLRSIFLHSNCKSKKSKGEKQKYNFPFLLELATVTTCSAMNGLYVTCSCNMLHMTPPSTLGSHEVQTTILLVMQMGKLRHGQDTDSRFLR